ATPPVTVDGYGVEATEVTNKMYASFLATNPSKTNQPAYCEWNATFTPLDEWPVAPSLDDYPVVFVDFCDAAAYCKWAGRKLCGRIGGGANAYLDYADPTKSEWYNACSAGGTLAYPYGVTYAGTACVGTDYDGQAGYQPGQDVSHPVGDAKGCEGGYP